MAERVSEDDVAAGVSQLASSLIALLVLGDVGLENNLICAETQSLNSLVSGVDEVQVIGGVLVVQEDEADLDAGQSVVISSLSSCIVSSGSLGSGGSGSCGAGAGAAACAQGENHAESHQQSDDLFHLKISLYTISLFIKTAEAEMIKENKKALVRIENIRNQCIIQKGW
jgi:hypothetical protein